MAFVLTYLHCEIYTFQDSCESLCPFHSTELVRNALKPVPARNLLLTCLPSAYSQGTSYTLLDNTRVRTKVTTDMTHPAMQGAPGFWVPWALLAALMGLSPSIRPCSLCQTNPLCL